MEIYGNLARRIRVLRRARGWSQETLAEQDGLHQSDVSLIESGRRKISFHTVGKLAKGFGVSVAELTEGVEVEE